MACCGLSSKNMTSMLGLLVFLSLSLIFGALGLIILYSAGLFSSKARFWAQTLHTVMVNSIPRMFNELVNEAYFIKPELKCVISGRLFGFSPAISGFVYKYFNLIVLSLMICIIIILLSLSINMIG